jgi:hypothetical protein
MMIRGTDGVEIDLHGSMSSALYMGYRFIKMHKFGKRT